MKEGLLRNIAIACAAVGLVFLFFLSNVIELKQTDINQITYEDIGKNVKICGEVTSKSVSKTNHVFVKLEDSTGKMSIVIFNNTAEKLNLDFEENGKICVTGSVDEYREKLEIIGNDVQVM